MHIYRARGKEAIQFINLSARTGKTWSFLRTKRVCWRFCLYSRPGCVMPLVKNKQTENTPKLRVYTLIAACADSQYVLEDEGQQWQPWKVQLPVLYIFIIYCTSNTIKISMRQSSLCLDAIQNLRSVRAVRCIL